MSVSLSDRINQKASISDLLDSIRALAFSADMTPEDWLAKVSSHDPIFTSDLAWLTGSDRKWVFSVAKKNLTVALIKFYPNELADSEHTKHALDPFVNWLEASPDYDLVEFSWNLMAWRPRLGWAGAWYPIRRMDSSGRLAGEISEENIDIAVTIVEEAEAMGRWPEGRWRFVQWDSDSQTYFKSLEDPSYSSARLLRTPSGQCCGVVTPKDMDAASRP